MALLFSNNTTPQDKQDVYFNYTTKTTAIKAIQ